MLSLGLSLGQVIRHSLTRPFADFRLRDTQLLQSLTAGIAVLYSGFLGDCGSCITACFCAIASTGALACKQLQIFPPNVFCHIDLQSATMGGESILK